MNLKEFKESYENDLGKSEEGAIKAFLIGVLEYCSKNPEGEDMIRVTLPKGELNASNKYLLDQFQNNPGIAWSYLGGTVDNSYKGSYDFEIKSVKGTIKEEKSSKVFVKSGGKDNPSPVHLKKNKHGIWKIFNFSSLATGVRKIEDDDF